LCGPKRAPPRRLLILLLLVGCTGLRAGRLGCAAGPALSATGDPLELAERFAKDAAFRRECLEESLVNLDNDYASARLANYDEQHWGSLPVAAFKTRPVVPADVGRPVPAPDASWRAIPEGAFAASLDGLKRRGEQMFTRFSAQIERALIPVLRDKNGPARYGLWQTADSVAGLVWVALPGGVYPSLTCSSCHSSVDGEGRPRPGVPNHQLDLGKAKDEYLNVRSLYSTWGPGREDIAADGRDDPVVIGDVRTVRLQRYLHRTANVKNSLPALALRVETGLIQAHYGSVRPERIDAFALAYYLWTLADGFDTEAPSRHPGHAVFKRHCGSCHLEPYLAGDAIPAASIRSPVANVPNSARGTGTVRTPSLLGVSARRWLLYGGEAQGIDGLLDPDRKQGGHYVGGELDETQRRAIAEYLKTL
jgi:mono/diheme cytochrome c family protein